MIQDIMPRRFDVTFRRPAPRADDLVFIFNGGRALLRDEGGRLSVPRLELIRQHFPEASQVLDFLFSIDGVNFFMGTCQAAPQDGFSYADVQLFREFRPPWLAFAGATACHIAAWRDRNRHCGHCGAPTEPSRTERALVCPACGQIVYPTISPVVIVGVTDGERLLMTRYAGRPYTRLALIAGFMEIGESMEDAVRREVMEEVGLKVKNIRYYKSQPWAFSQSLLSGFFADLDGAPDIKLDLSELSEAVWTPRDELPEEAAKVSLTYDMVDAFRRLDRAGA